MRASLMENLLSTAMMDEWRNYLRKANTSDIFEIIKKAITVAASDHPEEFQTKTDKIAQMLYSSSRKTLDETKSVSKVLNILDKSPETEDETIITESIPKDQLSTEKMVNSEKKVNRDGGTKVVYRQGLAEVMKIKEILEKSGTHESVLCDWLTKFQDMGLSINTLETTGIGKTVRALEKHGSKDVSHIAKTLIQRWKAMVDEYWINKESSIVIPISGQGKPMNLNSEKKSKVNLEKKANHSKIPVTPNQPSKETVIVQRKLEATKRKLPIGKEMELMLQRKKRPNNQNMDVIKKQSSVVISNKAPPAYVETGLQNPTNSTIPGKLDEQKFEATKRKLRKGYERAENMKRQRKTQVIEVHDLLSQGLAPKYQDRKFGKSTFSRLAGIVR